MKTHFLITAALTLATVTCFSQAANTNRVEPKQAPVHHFTETSKIPVPNTAIKKFTPTRKIRPYDSVLTRRKLPMNKLKK